jgi:Zn-dependent peptidase ImmA (M78 family)/transcriptional regulator with XRE-family HTH domain
MAGMSMEDLAQKLDGIVTKQAISKYETGQMLPAPEVLEKLVKVLKIATWGASPLRSGKKDMADICLKESPRLFAMESPMSPMFRRAGLLARLRKETAAPENLESPGDTAKQYFSISLDRLGDVQGPEPDEGIPARPKQASLALRDEGFPALAARRVRFVRAWESGSTLDDIRFRAGERLLAKTESALKYRIADHLQKYLELESVLGMPAAFENPIAGRPARTGEEVEAAATDVRRRWELGSGPVVNLLGVLEDKGIKIYETRGIEGFEGLSGRYGDLPFVAVSMEYPKDRIRFTAAHELGHVLCDFAAVESPEGECHAFGAAFLLPRAALEKVFTPSRRKVTLGDLAEIKETFGVSLQAIMYRAHGLGLVSDRQLRSFRETLKAKGWTKLEPVAYAGQERATRFRRLLHYAVAADILDVGRAAEMAGVTPRELEKEIGDIF